MINDLIQAYQSLFIYRRSTKDIKNKEHLEASIRMELLDELTHPRVRKNPNEKLRLAYERIDDSDIDKAVKVELKQVYEQVYYSVNTL